MNHLLDWLGNGDLRSDGLSQEVVRFVLLHPGLLEDLIQGITSDDDVIRGHTADALEHIARTLPEQLLPYTALIAERLSHDPVPMVRWHMAMAIGHLAADWKEPDQACSLLCGCLQDPSVFVVSWVIVSVCIFARIYPEQVEMVLEPIARLGSHQSVALRSKVRQAIQILSDDQRPFPKGWVKSQRIASCLVKPMPGSSQR